MSHYKDYGMLGSMLGSFLVNGNDLSGFSVEASRL